MVTDSEVFDQFDSRRSTVYSENGLVATSEPLAATAGINVLMDGGNAFDAAIAAMGVLNVVQPTHSGVGGDVFALYRTQRGEVGALQSCGWAPQDATLSTVREQVKRQGSDGTSRAVNTGESTPTIPTMPVQGALTVTVPGAPAGWEALVDRFGARSLSKDLQPAVEYATEGFSVSEVSARFWNEANPLLNTHGRNIYLVNGGAPQAGETVRLPALGETLETIGETGAKAVYDGSLTDAIIDTIQSHGGLLSAADLAEYEPTFVDPISTSYHGATVYELPPNNQGVIALEALNIAEEIDATDAPFESADRIHYFGEAMKLAFHDCHHHVTDPAFEEIPPLESKEYAADRAQSIGPTAIQNPKFQTFESADVEDTALVTVGDSVGNLVSVIGSLCSGFGSGLVAEGTGIALQNRGMSFSLDPTHPNRLEPRKRPFHTLVPALCKFGDDDWAAFGTVGGYQQPQGHVQIVSNIVDYGMTLQRALNVPRWRYKTSNQLAVEARTAPRIQNALARKGHNVLVLPPDQFGGAQIVRNQGGSLSGATEPRRGDAISAF